MNLPHGEDLKFEDASGDLVVVTLTQGDGSITVSSSDESFTATEVALHGSVLSYGENGLRRQLFVHVTDGSVDLVDASRTLSLKRHARDGGSGDDTDGPGTIVAPMPGKILELKVAAGDTVAKGDALLVMEAMKMEQTITAPRDGRIASIGAKAGEQVGDGHVLITIEDTE